MAITNSMHVNVKIPCGFHGEHVESVPARPLFGQLGNRFVACARTCSRCEKTTFFFAGQKEDDSHAPLRLSDRRVEMNEVTIEESDKSSNRFAVRDSQGELHLAERYEDHFHFYEDYEEPQYSMEFLVKMAVMSLLGCFRFA